MRSWCSSLTRMSSSPSWESVRLDAARMRVTGHAPVGRCRRTAPCAAGSGAELWRRSAGSPVVRKGVIIPLGTIRAALGGPFCPILAANSPHADVRGPPRQEAAPVAAVTAEEGVGRAPGNLGWAERAAAAAPRATGAKSRPRRGTEIILPADDGHCSGAPDAFRCFYRAGLAFPMLNKYFMLDRDKHARGVGWKSAPSRALGSFLFRSPRQEP